MSLDKRVDTCLIPGHSVCVTGTSSHSHHESSDRRVSTSLNNLSFSHRLSFLGFARRHIMLPSTLTRLGCVARSALRTSRSSRTATPSRQLFSATLPRYSAGLNVHRNAEGNTAETPFDFSAENYEKIAVILKKFPTNYSASAVISVLDLAQRQNGGWLPLSAMNKVAKVLNMAPIRVYEVASFYTMFNREPIGKYNVQVCTTTPCMLRGGNAILDACKKHMNVEVGGNSSDGLFHLMEVECLGACVNAPMVQINDHYYEDLTPDSVTAVLDQLKAGNKPKMGPQIDRNGCEGPHGRTTLKSAPSGPYCRDLKAAAEAAAAAAAEAAKKAPKK